jgi:hypothetical protein
MRRRSRIASAIPQRWMGVCKQEARPKRAACLELFIETDYCATNAALRNAYGGIMPWLCRSLGSVHKRTRFPRAFLLLCFTIIVLRYMRTRREDGEDGEDGGGGVEEKKAHRTQRRRRRGRSLPPPRGSMRTTMLAHS